MNSKETNEFSVLEELIRFNSLPQNIQYTRKPYPIGIWKKFLYKYPDHNRLSTFLYHLKNGFPIGLKKQMPLRLNNSNPNFPNSYIAGIYKTVAKWRQKQHILGPISFSQARRLNMTLNMLFGVPKPDGSIRPILNNSDASFLGFSVNDNIIESFKTVEYIQPKELIEIIMTMGKNAWLWAKDVKDGYCNVPVQIDDINNLAFTLADKVYFYQVLPMGLSSSCKIFADFMHFPIFAIRADRPDLYIKKVKKCDLNLENFNLNLCNVFPCTSDPNYVLVAWIFHYVDDIIGGHTDQKEAWEQFNHSEDVLKQLLLPTKLLKAKIPKQQQELLGKLYDTVKQ